MSLPGRDYHPAIFLVRLEQFADYFPLIYKGFHLLVLSRSGYACRINNYWQNRRRIAENLLIKSKLLSINNIHIDSLRERFIVRNELTTKDLFEFYRKMDERVLKSTVNRRVFELIKNGILERVGKGKFIWSSETKFQLSITDSMKQLHV